MPANDRALGLKAVKAELLKLAHEAEDWKFEGWKSP
jgi:hypothetical protein